MLSFVFLKSQCHLECTQCLCYNKPSGMLILMAGLLILRDGAISHNRPKIATNRIIHEKLHNLFKIAQFKKRKTKISLCIKFSDILIIILGRFIFQMASKLTWKRSFVEETINKAFYASFYMLGTWC